MRPISYKAVLISNAVNIGMMLAICVCAALATLGVAWVLAGGPTDIIR